MVDSGSARPRSSELSSRVIALTGGSAGIGLVVARELIGHGATVVLLSRGKQALDEATASLGEQAVPIVTDVGDPDSVRAAFSAIEERFGRLDVLINNAGIGWPHRIEQVTDEELAEEVGTNLLGPLYTIRSAVALLRRSEDPHIVNISSDVVREPMPYLLVYAATKAALEMLSAGLLHELRPDGIRVSVIRVGQTEGGGFRFHWEQSRREEAERVWEALGFKQRVSIGTVGQPPEEVAEAVIYVITRPKGSIVSELGVRAHSGAPSIPPVGPA